MLKNKVALVTGATSEIGKATALAFGIAGVKVVFSGRRKTEGKETEAQLRVVSQKHLSNKRTGLVRIALSNHSKDFVDEFHLRYTVPLTDSFHLSFVDHVHGLNPSQSSLRCVE